MGAANTGRSGTVHVVATLGKLSKNSDQKDYFSTSYLLLTMKKLACTFGFQRLYRSSGVDKHVVCAFEWLFKIVKPDFPCYHPFYL